jgi:hypothetical protein
MADIAVTTAKPPKWLPLFKKYLKYLRIQSKHATEDIDGTGIQLNLWTSQTRVLEEICQGLDDGIHVFFVLKSRQLGVTTITIAITLFWLAYHPNTIGCLVSDSEKGAAKNRETVRRYVASLSAFMGKSFSLDKRLGAKDNKFGFTFSNNSRLDMLVAGTKKNWGEGEGYVVGHLTEVSSYGKEEGLESFRHAMAPENPRALYLLESTAHGNNHWKDMWEAAMLDEYTSRCIFVGWWSNDLQRIREDDRRFQRFGTAPPTPDEIEKITKVKKLYNFDITMEQLAWYRMEMQRPNANDADMAQNQPFTSEEAFVVSGVSFFGPKRIQNRIDEIRAAKPGGVEEGGFGYKAYEFYLADEYHLSKVEAITQAIKTDQIKMRVWEYPHPDGMYVIGADPAGGRSELSNHHCCSVWRVFADKMVQVAEWADGIAETRHCAWVLAYLAGQYKNCRINIDLTGGIGTAVMQSFDDLRVRMRSELYQNEIRMSAEREIARKLATDPTRPKRPENAPAYAFDFDDFLSAATWHMYRRIDSPGPGFQYNTVVSQRIKFHTMNILRDSFVVGLLEIRSIPLLEEMLNVVQDTTKIDIGASAPGRLRDDRTFAMALANSTWLENLRGGLISQGVTYGGSLLKESGQLSPIADNLNRRIMSIMQAADQMMDAPPPRTFFEHRGLL